MQIIDYQSIKLTIKDEALSLLSEHGDFFTEDYN